MKLQKIIDTFKLNGFRHVDLLKFKPSNRM